MGRETADHGSNGLHEYFGGRCCCAAFLLPRETRELTRKLQGRPMADTPIPRRKTRVAKGLLAQVERNLCRLCGLLFKTFIAALIRDIG